MGAVLDLPKTTSLQAIKQGMKLALEEENSVILSNVAWKTYTQFIEETMDKIRNPRFYFDEGNLLIMSVTPEHEYYNRLIASLIDALAEQFKEDWLPLGSTTYTKNDIEKGFEPDSCFYFENAPKMRGVKRLDMSVHPAPELIVEVDITSLSIFRQNIYAAFGVPEIWRFDGEKIEILKLEEGKYIRVENSLALPLVTPEKLTEFIRESENLSRLEWIGKIRDWCNSVR
jgi:Uma2 family endonuclease